LVYSNSFLSAEEFHQALRTSIKSLKEGNLSEISAMWLYFAPTCDWDDLIGKDGMDLANQIFELLSDLEKS
jgi:hypothetical protein